MRSLAMLTFPILFSLASCYGGSGNDRSSSSSGGSGASSGSSATGGSHTGGLFGGGSSNGGSNNGGSAGDDCGPCPGVACQQGLTLQVSPDPGTATGGPGDVTIEVQGPTPVTVTCSSAGADCSMYCYSNEYQMADGHYSLTVSASGFTTQVLEFDIANPTNCGCCGCCPASYSNQVALVADGTPTVSCCYDTTNDPQNCGSCGHACAEGATCVAGLCQPALSACLEAESGATTCSAFCTDAGLSCSLDCESVAGFAGVGWTGTAGCPSAPASDGLVSCGQLLDFGTAGSPNSYRCCCAEP